MKVRLHKKRIQVFSSVDLGCDESECGCVGAGTGTSHVGRVRTTRSKAYLPLGTTITDLGCVESPQCCGTGEAGTTEVGLTRLTGQTVITDLGCEELTYCKCSNVPSHCGSKTLPDTIWAWISVANAEAYCNEIPAVLYMPLDYIGTTNPYPSLLTLPVGVSSSVDQHYYKSRIHYEGCDEFFDIYVAFGKYNTSQPTVMKYWLVHEQAYLGSPGNYVIAGPFRTCTNTYWNDLERLDTTTLTNALQTVVGVFPFTVTFYWFGGRSSGGSGTFALNASIFFTETPPIYHDSYPL